MTRPTLKKFNEKLRSHILEHKNQKDLDDLTAFVKTNTSGSINFTDEDIEKLRNVIGNSFKKENSDLVRYMLRRRSRGSWSWEKDLDVKGRETVVVERVVVQTENAVATTQKTPQELAAIEKKKAVTIAVLNKRRRTTSETLLICGMAPELTEVLMRNENAQGGTFMTNDERDLLYETVAEFARKLKLQETLMIGN